jgi:hypothetical protein
VPIDDELAGLMQRPAMRAALEKAVRVHANRGGTFDPESGTLPFAVLDQAKKELDAMARYASTPAGGAEIGDVGAVRDLTRDYLRALDARIPGYADARATSAEPIPLQDALEAGRAFLRGDSDAPLAAVGQMNPQERQMFQLGAARELQHKLSKVRDSNDRARLFENDDMRQRLRAIFPERQQLDRFLRAVEEESMMNRTRNEAIKGSPTAKNLGEDSRSMGEAASTAIDVASGNPIMSGLRVGANMLKSAPSMTRQEAEAVARLGTNPDLGAVLPRVAMAPVPAPPRNPMPVAQVPLLGDVPISPLAPAGGSQQAQQIRRGEEPMDGPRPENLPQTPKLNILRTPDIQAGANVDLKNTDAGLRTRFVNLQRQFGSRLPVTSAYRSEAHNKAVGGAEKSQHLEGNALDIDVSSMPLAQRRELLRMASEMGFTGIGVYGNSIHLDMGERRAWGPSRKSDSIPRWAQSVIGQHMGMQ